MRSLVSTPHSRAISVRDKRRDLLRVFFSAIMALSCDLDADPARR
jgi:hypothetical protein